jgi:hypothetical protein
MEANYDTIDLHFLFFIMPNRNPTITITLTYRDNDCHFFDIKYNGILISISCFLSIEEDVLLLKEIDIEGPGADFYGSRLKSIISQIGKEFCLKYNVSSVMLSGARRTTGKFKGKIPKPIFISI